MPNRYNIDYTPGKFPINLDENAYERPSLQQGRDPQTLGAELQQRSDISAMGGDGGLTGDALLLLQQLLGQDLQTRQRDDSAYTYQGSQLAGGNRYYIPPQDSADYSDADARMMNQRVEQGVMGSMGGKDNQPIKAYLRKLDPVKMKAINDEMGLRATLQKASDVNKVDQSRLADIADELYNKFNDAIPGNPYIGPKNPALDQMPMRLEKMRKAGQK